MFPIPWNFPFRKKNGDMSTIGAEIGGAGSELPPHSSSDAGKLLGVKPNGSLEWSDTVNSEIQTLTNNVGVLVENGAVNKLPNNATTQTITGIQITVNADKSMTIGGSGNSATVDIFNDANNPILISEDCKFSCGATFTSSTCEIVATATDNTTYSLKLSTGNSITIPAGKEIKKVTWYNNASYNESLTIYPMIADADYSGGYVPYAMTNRELTPIKATITPASGITLARNSIIKEGKLVHIFFKIESPAPDTSTTDVVIGTTPFLPEDDFVFISCYDIDRPFEIKHSAFIRRSSGEIVFPAGSTVAPVYGEMVYACQ